MAGAIEPDKAALLAEIAATRGELTAATDGLREAMDFGGRARRNLQEHRGRWFAVAGLTGVAAFFLRRREKIVYVERSTGKFLGVAGKAGAAWTGLKLVGSLA